MDALCVHGWCMGLSETIIAASIGAAATVAAAAFQLMSGLRAAKADSRPKRGSTVRSIAAVVALMAVSAVGGFLFSEFRNERAAQDLHSLREELNAKLQALTETTQRLADLRGKAEAAQVSMPDQLTAAPSSSQGSVESVLYAPACQAGADCTEANTRPVALCGAIPSAAQARKFELFIKGAGDAQPSRADFEQDLGGAKFSGPPTEHPEAGDRKAVCVNFLHWSEQPHIATLVLHYGSAVAVGPERPDATTQPTTSATHASATPLANGQPVSLTAAKP